MKDELVEVWKVQQQGEVAMWTDDFNVVIEQLKDIPFDNQSFVLRKMIKRSKYESIPEFQG